MSVYVVGLTGGIGSGKSAAADHFVTRGIETVDADIASRIVVEPGRPALVSITQKFGDSILLKDGQLDRTALRHLVFASEDKRRWLQSLLHPLISAQLRTQLDQAVSPYVILVNPLLFESRQHQWCKRTLIIDVAESTQLERTMARDENSREQVENIMRAQMSRDQRLNLADDIISNEQELTHLHQAVEAQHQEYLKLCQKPPE